MEKRKYLGSTIIVIDRVANIFKFWVDNFFMDIKKDSKNLEFITDFFDTQSLDLKANSLFLILGESVKQKVNYRFP